MKALLEKIRRILRDRRTRKFLTRFVSGIAAIVVFVTTYALVLPAITMESQAACGIEAHQHDDSCYSEKLICGQEESEGHHHTDDCYTLTRELECQIQEHRHSSENGCFDEEGNLVCKLEEHTHSDSCYKEHRELTCGLEESEGHHHTDSCYEKVLTCGKEVHTHSAACYQVDPEVESAAVASTGMTSAAAVPDLSEKDYYSQESGDSEDDALVIKSLDEPEQTDADEDRDNGKISPEDNSEGETEADSEADIKDEKADRDRIKAESDDVDKDDERDKGKDKDISEEREEDASSFSTGFAADEDVENGDAYIPDKDALDFSTVLNRKTGIYFSHVAEDEDIEDSSAITDWTRADEDTELNPQDIVRVYLSYTLPKDTINATNDISRYRLPDALHLTDEQIEAINSCENGISAQYINYDNLEITDPDRHTTYLGLESVEGTRRPGEKLKEDSQEYISAVVRAEKIYDEDTGEYEGTDLIFTFSPYAVEKNAHEYDKKGQPTRAGEEVTGWLTLDFNMGQIDWDEDNTSEIVFAEEDKISTVLKQADSEEAETDESAADGTIEAAAEYATEEAATETTTSAETAAENSTEAAAAATAATAATASETAAESIIEKTDADAKTDSENDKDKNINEETAVAAYPAAVFDDSITVRSGRLDTDLADTNLPKKTKMTVHVEADEGTFPEGTKMVLSTVEDLDAVAEAVGTAVDAKTRGFQAVDITFYDKDPSEEDAKEIQPLKPIRVFIKSDEIKKAAEDSSTAPVVVHIEEDNTATAIENTASETDSGTIEIEKPGVEEEKIAPENVNEDADSTTPENDNDGEAESSVTDRQTVDEGIESSSPVKSNDNVNTENTESQQDNTGAERDNTDSAKDWTIGKSALENNSDDSKDSAYSPENLPDNSVESNEKSVIPAESIAEPADTFTEVNDRATEYTSESETGTVDSGGNDILSFEADSFSVYAIVYTVDFHYELNGKVFDYSITGGNAIAFSTLVRILGIAGEPGPEDDVLLSDEGETEKVVQADAEETIDIDEFIDNIDNVEFTDETLLCVSHVKENTTVGAIKSVLGLECEYSAELTDEDIAEINATEISAPDWVLISLKAFDTEESLIVTMKNGEVFEIRVTDLRDPLGLHGRTFSIIVNRSNNGNDWHALTTTILNKGEYGNTYGKYLRGTDFSEYGQNQNDGYDYCKVGSPVWEFEYIGRDNLYRVKSDGKYLYIDPNVSTKQQTSDNTMTLVDQPGDGSENDGTLITITSDNDGNYYFKNKNNLTLTNYGNNNGVNRFWLETNGTNDANQYGKIRLAIPENMTDDNASHKASLISAADTQLGQNIVIYQRVWVTGSDGQPVAKYYAIDGNGGLVPLINSSDAVYWRGNKSIEWTLVDKGSGYYTLQNTSTGKYLTPKSSADTAGIVHELTDFNDGDEKHLSISLPGRDSGTYTSQIACWDYDAKMTNGPVVTIPEGTTSPTITIQELLSSQEFYFAARDPVVQDHLTTVATVDSKSKGIKITMYDWGDPRGLDAHRQDWDYGRSAVQDRLKQMQDIMGSGADTYVTQEYTPNILDRTIQTGSEYPNILTNSGHNLGELFSDQFIKGGSQNKDQFNNLFLQSVYDESGFYKYSCFENYAYLPTGSTDFTVYEQIGTPSIRTPDMANQSTNIIYERGNFMPYNPINSAMAYRQNLYDPDLESLPSTDPRYNERLYYIENALPNGKNAWYNNQQFWGSDNPEAYANYFFGMKMEAKFTQNPGGIADNGDPMVYEFNGDDDLWIYIDDVLVLDLGGVHDAFRGKIDFSTGRVTCNANNGVPTTIKTMFQLAGKFPDGSDWDDALVDDYFNGDTFKDYSTHTFKMFYMERGASASDLDMQFNLPVLTESQFRVRKEMPETETGQLVQQDYMDAAFYYQAHIKDENGWHVVTPGYLTQRYNAGKIEYSNAYYDDEERTPVVWKDEENGIFEVKPGHTAIFPAADDSQEWWVEEVEPEPGMSNMLDFYTVSNSSPKKNSDGTFDGKVSSTKKIQTRNIVIYQNKPDDKLVNELRITKHIIGTPYNANDIFEYRILLESGDGEMVAYKLGNYYQIDAQGRYVYFRNGERIIQSEYPNGPYSFYNDANEWVTNSPTPRYAGHTSVNGSVDSIQNGDSIVIPGLLEGTEFYVYERTNYDYMAKDANPVENKYVFKDTVMEGAAIRETDTTPAVNWPEHVVGHMFDPVSGLDDTLDFYNASDYERLKAAEGIIVQDDDAWVLVENEPCDLSPIEIEKIWPDDSNFSMDQLDNDSKVNFTIKRYKRESKRGTIEITGTFKTQMPGQEITDEKPHKADPAYVFIQDGKVVKTVKYSDGTNGVVTVNDLPIGTYTVMSYDHLLGYDMTYTATPSTVTITEAGTAQTTIECTYTRQTGTLIIEKQLTGDYASHSGETMTYTITGPDDYSNTVTVTVEQIRQSGGTWIHTLSNMPVGEYTIVEAVDGTAGKHTPSITTAMVTKNGETTAKFQGSYSQKIPVTFHFGYRGGQNDPEQQNWVVDNQKSYEYIQGSTISATIEVKNTTHYSGNYYWWTTTSDDWRQDNKYKNGYNTITANSGYGTADKTIDVDIPNGASVLHVWVTSPCADSSWAPKMKGVTQNRTTPVTNASNRAFAMPKSSQRNKTQLRGVAATYVDDVTATNTVTADTLPAVDGNVYHPLAIDTSWDMTVEMTTTGYTAIIDGQWKMTLVNSNANNYTITYSEKDGDSWRETARDSYTLETSGENAGKHKVEHAVPVNNEYTKIGEEYVSINDGNTNRYLTDNANLLWYALLKHGQIPATDENGDLYYYYISDVEEDHVPKGMTPTFDMENGKTLMTWKGKENNRVLIVRNNLLRNGALQITKNVKVNGAAPTADNKTFADGTFTYTIAAENAPGTILHTVTITFVDGIATKTKVDDGQEQTITDGGNSCTVIIPELEEGNYIITEAITGDMTLLSVMAGTTSGSVENSNVTASVTAGQDTPGGNAVAIFTNNITELSVKKVDATVAGHYLSGAKFILYNIDGVVVEANQDGSKVKILNSTTGEMLSLDNLHKFAVPEGGVRITGLSDGSYKLVEKEAPAGYIITEETTTFTITNGIVSQWNSENTAETAFEISNPPGAELPYTGGPGTRMFTILGSVLLAFAGIVLIRRRRII